MLPCTTARRSISLIPSSMSLLTLYRYASSSSTSLTRMESILQMFHPVGAVILCTERVPSWIMGSIGFLTSAVAGAQFTENDT